MISMIRWKIKHPIYILTFISVIVFFYAKNSLPGNLSFDEVEFAKLALSLWGKPYTVYSSLATGHSTLYFYILLLFLKILGTNSFSLRFPSALFGIIDVILIYELLIYAFGKKLLAFTGALILLTSHWFVNFSRFSFEATFLIFLELTCLFLLNKYLQNKKNHFLVLSAMFAGLAFHSYYPGRIFFLLPAYILLIKFGWKNLFSYLAVSTFIILPLVFTLIFSKDIRISQTFLYTDKDTRLTEKITATVDNIEKTVMMPFTTGDYNGRHNFPGKPALNPILGLLFLLGMFVVNSKENKEVRKYMFVYIFISALPTLMTKTSDNPSMLRTITVLPGIIYFICSGILSGYYIIYGKILKQRLHTTLLISVLIIISIFYELRTYFIYQSRVTKNSFEVICPLEKVVNLASVPTECRVNKNMF